MPDALGAMQAPADPLSLTDGDREILTRRLRARDVPRSAGSERIVLNLHGDDAICDAAKRGRRPAARDSSRNPRSAASRTR